MDTIGKRIHYLRYRKDLKQWELARQLYVEPSTVSSWERGNTRPNYEAVVKIAEIFGVTTDYLLRGK